MSGSRWTPLLVGMVLSCAVITGCDEPPVHDASDTVFVSLVWTRDDLEVSVVTRASGTDALSCAPLARNTEESSGAWFESDGPVRIVDVKCDAAGFGGFRLRLPMLERALTGGFDAASMAGLEDCRPLHWEGGLTEEDGEVGPAEEWLECSSELLTTSAMDPGLVASNILVQL